MISLEQNIPFSTPKHEETDRREFELLAENSDDFIGMCDLAGIPFYVNPAALRMVGLASLEEMRRTTVRDFFFPEDQDFIHHEFLPRVLREGSADVEIRFRHFVTGSAIWVRYCVFVLKDDSGEPMGFGTISRDITEAKRERDILRISEERLRDTQTRLEEALLAGEIATWTFDVVNNRVVADRNLARLFSVSPEDAAGGSLDPYLQAVHPDDRPRVAETIADALAQHDRYECEYRVILPDGSCRWLVARGSVERDEDGKAIAMPGVVVDITERVERERREQFLAQLSAQTQRLTDPHEIIVNAVRAVGEFLNLSRCALADIDIDADICTVPYDYCADDSVASIVGSFPISAFGQHLINEFAAGRAVAVNDVRSDPGRVAPENVGAYDAFGIRSYIAAPVVHSARTVSCIACHANTVRQWKPEEVELVRSVVEHTWFTVELHRQRAGLIREAEERGRLAKSNSLLLDSTTDGIYGIDSQGAFTFVNRAAAAMFGYSQEEMFGHNAHDLIHHTRPNGLPYLREDCPIYRAMHGNQGCHIDEELYWRKNGAPFPVAYSAAPIIDDGVVQGAVVTFNDISERQALQQAQAALFERERNIASQLQAALQPALPGILPGIAVTKYYEAALFESSVGGDFYDVFLVDKGCTILVVGDLSGKGLAAASQVATVRNMLRAFLYSKPTIVEAVTDLNRTLAVNMLLTGFATLFVGAFDSANRSLTYINCGQEPALVKRNGTGAVELLTPTGPILGTIENASFTDSVVTLSCGDALAIFSDGLTEVGPSRREMLGIEGLVELFKQDIHGADYGTSSEMAEAVAVHIIEGVDAAASGGVMRDDMCLLVAVVD